MTHDKLLKMSVYYGIKGWSVKRPGQKEGKSRFMNQKEAKMFAENVARHDGDTEITLYKKDGEVKRSYKICQIK